MVHFQCVLCLLTNKQASQWWGPSAKLSPKPIYLLSAQRHTHLKIHSPAHTHVHTTHEHSRTYPRQTLSSETDIKDQSPGNKQEAVSVTSQSKATWEFFHSFFPIACIIFIILSLTFHPFISIPFFSATSTSASRLCLHAHNETGGNPVRPRNHVFLRCNNLVTVESSFTRRPVIRFKQFWSSPIGEYVCASLMVLKWGGQKNPPTVWGTGKEAVFFYVVRLLLGWFFRIT